jgi:hypothetical protein
MVRRDASLEAKQKSSAYNTAWKAKERAKGTDKAVKIRNREREYMRVRAGTGEGYRKLWLSNCKHRASKKGVPFDLTLDDLVFPDICPILGIPMVMRSGAFHDNSPSIDRMVPTKGYVKGNVQIISYRANRLKAHGTLDDLRKIVAWMELHG